MGYRNIKTQVFNVTFERMGSSDFNSLVQTWDGADVDLTGSAIHLWVMKPTPSQPITFTPTQVTPGTPWTTTLGHLVGFVTEADLTSWGLYPGTYPFEILTSNDGGTTTDKVAKGNFVIGSWITNTF